MNKDRIERRCKGCGKLLLDEKLPFCRRCVLEGRNKVTEVGGYAGAAALAAISFFGSYSKKDGSGNDDAD